MIRKHGLIFILILIIGAYIGWSVYTTEQEYKKKANSEVKLFITPEHVQEIGYIMDRRVMSRTIPRQKKVIAWSIKIPSTNKVYECSWVSGFADYYKDDSVLLIHMPDGGPKGIDWSGYIIGIHGNQNGKRTDIEALDADDLDFLLDMDEDS